MSIDIKKKWHIQAAVLMMGRHVKSYKSQCLWKIIVRTMKIAEVVKNMNFKVWNLF